MISSCSLQLQKPSSRRWLLLLLFVPPLAWLSSTGYSLYTDRARAVRDSYMAMAWDGFGLQEKGMYNFTLVTAMLDIGRGAWTDQARGYNTYLLYMQRVLRLDVSMLIFIDRKGKPFVEWMRRGRERRTKIVVVDIKDLPYHKYRDRISEIMRSEEYKRDNTLVEKHLCESYIPEYDIVQLSKLYFVDRAVQENPFNTTYFMWMDGGYGKGEDIHPSGGIWLPRNLFEYHNQITLIERDPGVMKYLNSRPQLHKMSINVLVGGFHAGGGEAFREWYRMQEAEMAEWMSRGVIDDDQTMNMMLYYKRPSLFRLVRADWYDTFKLFNAYRLDR